MLDEDFKIKLSEKLLTDKKKFSEETFSSQAYLTIRNAINHLELEPGESFLEREIAEMLDMSRTPVHSALIRLEMDGWLDIIPRKGITVSPIKAQNIKNISQITEALDGVAVELALGNLTDDHLSRLENLINQQEACLVENDFETYVDIDHEFHGLITTNCNNEELIKLLESYSDQLFRARLYTIDDRVLPLRSINEHKAILAALQAENGMAARTLMETHRNRGNKEIVKIIEEKTE